MNPLSVSYIKIRNEMHQIHSRKVNEVHILIVVNLLVLKYQFLEIKNCTFVCLMLLRHFKLLCTVYLMLICYLVWEIAKDFLSFGADHLVQMSGHLCHIDTTALFASSAIYATKQRIQKGYVCPSVHRRSRTVGQTGKELQEEARWVEAFDGTLF